MRLVISDVVRTKLHDKHAVSEKDVIECFATRERTTLIDTREEHKTDPATQWFVAETFMGKELAVYFMIIDGEIHIKSAFSPGIKRKSLYQKLSTLLPY